MAKSRSFFGLRTGSTKTLTFQVNNGKQVTKDRVYIVKNPKTNAQMRQRACFATVTAAYKTLAEICDHSFEGVEGKTANQSTFVRKAIELMRTRSEMFNPSGWKFMLPNPYLIADGSLSFNVSVATNFEPYSDKHNDKTFTVVECKGLSALCGDNDKVAAFTWADFCSAAGVEAGDQVTFVALMPYVGSTHSGGMDSTALKLVRVIVPESSALKSPCFELIDSSLNLWKFKNIGQNSQVTDDFLLRISANIFEFGFYNLAGETDEVGIIAASVIRSKYANSSWKRSRAELSVVDYTTMGWYGKYTMEYILPTWDPSGNLYLNNAKTNNSPSVWE